MTPSSPHNPQASLVLATLVRQMPLPPTGPQPGDAPWDPSTVATISSSPSTTAPPPPLLSGSQLAWCGSVLLRLLFDMKHNGAVEKTSLALAVVTERLLRAPCHDLNVLPRPWLEVGKGEGGAMLFYVIMVCYNGMLLCYYGIIAVHVPHAAALGPGSRVRPALVL